MTTFVAARAPLERRAAFAWRFAWSSRHAQDPIVRGQCRATLAIALCDPHTRIRRVAGEGESTGPATIYPLNGRLGS